MKKTCRNMLWFAWLLAFLLIPLPEQLLFGQTTGVRAPRKEGEQGKVIQFSGYTWKVKAASYATGPGPNYFSWSQDNVFVDKAGYLTLGIHNRNGRWLCSEVVSSETFGFGRFTFVIASSLDLLDQHVVAALFTWDPESPPYYREFDIEFSRWGEKENKNSQYVVQSAIDKGGIHRFHHLYSQESPVTTHVIDWTPEGIWFRSYQGKLTPLQGSGDAEVEPFREWHFSHPTKDEEAAVEVRMNLWLYLGKGPSNGSRQELKIEAFSYQPCSFLPGGVKE